MSEETETNNSWKSSWRDALKLSHKKYDYIMLTDANYEDDKHYDNGEENPYWVGQFHSVKLANGMYRSWRATDDDNSTLNLRLDAQDPRVSYPKNRFFFNIVHFDIYRKDVVKDANQNVVIAKNGPNAGQPYKAFQPVTSIKGRKALAKNPDEDTVFMRKKYLEVGPAHYDNLLQIIDKAKEICMCGGSLSIQNYSCENCGVDLLDMDDSDLTTEDVMRFEDGPKRCRDCRHKGFPVPVLECDSCEDSRPHRFDQVVAKVKKTGSGPQTVITVDDVISAKEFLLENKEHIVEMDDDNEPILEDGQFLYTEDLETISTAYWNFDRGNPAPSNGEVSSFLGLTPDEDGYSTESTQYGTKKKAVNRRRFR